jgi:hypothetical protein
MGLVVFSADFEMAWAFRYSKTLASKAVEIGLKERENVPTLLDLFDKYQIPATWATVGHLFLNECSSRTNRELLILKFQDRHILKILIGSSIQVTGTIMILEQM